MAPFLVLGLPRSRTAWLARFLTYRDHICGHEELRHMRSLDDVKSWFSQDGIGSAETAAAPWWRLLSRFAPNARIVLVRRPVEDVVASLLRLRGLAFDRLRLEQAMKAMDRKLDQIAARVPGVLSVNFDDLSDEAVCTEVFEHCLPYAHDHEHWAALAPVNVQCDMRAMTRYAQAYTPAMNKLATIAKQQILTGMAVRKAVPPDGVTFQVERFDDWVHDATMLFDDHLVQVGEAPGDWRKKNLTLMRRLDEAGCMQIMTARSNGRMFGYLMTVIGPSLESETGTIAANTTFYTSDAIPGLGLKLQRAALAAMIERGANDIHYQAGVRGSGEKMSALYRRLGAEDAGRVYRLQLTEH